MAEGQVPRGGVSRVGVSRRDVSGSGMSRGGFSGGRAAGHSGGQGAKDFHGFQADALAGSGSQASKSASVMARP